MPGPLQPLLDLHADFLEALLLHQEALVRGDLAAALTLVEGLGADMRAHMRHEEEKLLPVLERGGGWSRIGHPDYYRQDHAKLREMLDDIAARTRALDAGDHRGVALLIGHEQRFRSLLEHHDEREVKALYPDLERLASPQEQAELALPPM